MREDYEMMVGIETHAELKTKTKVFCGCENSFGAESNAHCCPVCIGLPGALPVLNKTAVKLAIKAGLCLGSCISPIAVFDRKNYFYPDLPKSYQISQLDKPICKNGGIKLDSGKMIKLNRIHLEEDAGKLIHKSAIVGTFVDYNRGGVPLIESVTETFMSSADEVIEYLTKLRLTLIYAGIADCKMEQGGMRCDVNLSVKKKSDTKLGTKIEMKNLNSFKMVRRAILYESERQIEELEKGHKILQETRKWDDNKGKSFSMRSKENSEDYRYFPDPDILSVQITKEEIEKIAKEIPMLPSERKEKYITVLGIPKNDAIILISEKMYSDYFEKCLTILNEPKIISNWILSDLLKTLKENEKFELKDLISEKDLCQIISLVKDKVITRTIAKELLDLAIKSKKTPDELIKELKLVDTVSASFIEKLVDDILNLTPSLKEDYKTEPIKIENFIIGNIMKKTQNKAKIDTIKSIFAKKMSK